MLLLVLIVTDRLLTLFHKQVILKGFLWKYQLELHGQRQPWKLRDLILLGGSQLTLFRYMTPQENFYLYEACFNVLLLQICPLKRPIRWKGAALFSSPSLKSFSFPVKGGLTMELAISQFWSSGIGSHEATVVDFEVLLLISF